jgi:hypothetical protein
MHCTAAVLLSCAPLTCASEVNRKLANALAASRAAGGLFSNTLSTSASGHSMRTLGLGTTYGSALSSPYTCNTAHEALLSLHHSAGPANRHPTQTVVQGRAWYQQLRFARGAARNQHTTGRRPCPLAPRVRTCHRTRHPPLHLHLISRAHSRSGA